MEKLWRSNKDKSPEPSFPVTNKAGKEINWSPSLIAEKIEKDDAALYHSILAIYDSQTESEKSNVETFETNGAGFSAFDGEIMSSFSEQLIKRHFLSPKQKVIARKKMKKYRNQIFEIIIKEYKAIMVPAIGEKNTTLLLRYSDWKEKLAELVLSGEAELQFEDVKQWLPTKSFKDTRRVGAALGL